MSIINEIKESFRKGSLLTRLIYVNIGVFLVLRILNVFFFLGNQNFPVLNWLALPSNIHELALRPWTLLSYMFVHFGFLHILFNILWLYWMGKIFLLYFNEKQLLSLYLMGGFCGGIVYLAAYNIFPAFTDNTNTAQLIGASASVLAIIGALAVYAPNHPINLLFIGQVKMKYFALASIIIYFIGIDSSNPGGNLAHIGGAFIGVLFALTAKKNTDISAWLTRLIDWLKKKIKPRPKIRITYRNGTPDMEYNKRKNQQQDEINRVLEKISKSGYDSLTREEKELLFKMGK